ncbi:DNA polymerase [Alcaligenaceae bacterium]|nr:DNA polymerase [Alcaligenaceae bacterium]
MLFAWAIDDGPVSVHDYTLGCQLHGDPYLPFDLSQALQDPNVLVYAHNSGFDRTVLRHTHPDICPPVERWRDTMVRALAHGLPGALGTLCEVLKIDSDKAKDKEGRQLLMLFCKPRPAGSAIRRATRETHPAEWAKFIHYAGQDIEAMREIDKVLPEWNYRGFELDLWHLDQRINDRGVAVDTDLANAAITTVEREQKALAKRTQELTDDDVQAATQRDAMLAHVLVEYGVNLPDMQQSTLERRINDPDLPEPLRELLAIRLQASTTSTAKYRTLIKGASSDGRLRGTLQFCGASRTGRWSGRMFQPQNLPRPTLKQPDIDFGIEALKAGCADLVTDNVMALTSSAIRGCIVAPRMRKLVIADLANIEGRMLAWLAGEEWKLQAFRDYDAGTGPDLYKLAYAKAFGIHPDDVDDHMRQIGKVKELMLGYEGGVGAYITGAATYRIDLEAMAEHAIDTIPAEIKQEALRAHEWATKKKRTFGLTKRAYVVCDSFKRLWRNANPEISSWWKELENNVVAAINNPGKTRYCRRVMVRRDGNWLRIGLPSGRVLCYPSPQTDGEGKVSYMGNNQYTRKWQRLKTYGGKLVENITQAAARDILAANMAKAESQGYAIVLTVHDELITEANDFPGWNHEDLAKIMSTNPEWAEGLPLAAAGFETYRYRKD